jgi:DNA-binding transcriptional MerR regulator
VATAARERNQTPKTIGAVYRLLKEEFPDISISKIRYLEDQGLLALHRTHGGYRLFTDEDVERLRTILRLQRDEFLPLRVIRDELTSSGRGKRDRKRPAAAGVRSRMEIRLVDLDELCERSGADPAFVKELEEYGIVEETGGRGTGYPEGDADVVATCARLARYGIEPRNLRAIRTGVEREAALVEAIVAPALRSKSAESRKGGLEDLDALAGLTLELSQQLFWRSLRALVSRT